MIELTLAGSLNKRKVSIVADAIQALAEGDANYAEVTAVYLDSTISFNVKESRQEILNAIADEKAGQAST